MPIKRVLIPACLLLLICLAAGPPTCAKQGPPVRIGAGLQLIVGGFDPSSRADAARNAEALDRAVPRLKALGVTSHEVYVRWNLCEVAPIKWDWSVYDRYLDVYKKHGLKWVPFLICGSAYSLPDWYYKKPGSQGYICLEHHEECDVQSLWNPTLRQHVAAFIKAFCEHYRDTNTIESILLGITGNYGEAIYPVTGNDWTADVHGKYHTHPGFWAGDKYADASFQTWLARKYGGSDRLRDAWGGTVSDLTKAHPFLRRDAPNERAWLDMADWYIGSMTDYARFWLRETRKNFKGDIYLCTGGHAPAEHGSDFGDQCKAAAEFGAGVRITNEASDYKLNFALTRWVASAGRQYRAYFSFEPAGGVDANGVIARIYNATASGAKGLHYYYGNLFDSEAHHANFVKFGGEFKQRSPRAETAVYYPETDLKLNGGDYLGMVMPLRDRFDFDYQSDHQVQDGGLHEYKALVLIHGNTSEEKVWRAILDWVRKGGTLFYPEQIGRMRTPEGDDSVHDLLFGPNAKLGLGHVQSFPFRGTSVQYRDAVTKALQGMRSPIRALPEPRILLTPKMDGVEDGVFVSQTSPLELLWLNSTNTEVRKLGITLPPHSIVTQTLPTLR